jgi:hypothetical protein
MNIAEGSLEECRYYLILAQDLGYVETTHLSVVAEEVSRLLGAYAAAILAPDSCLPYTEGISRAKPLPHLEVYAQAKLHLAGRVDLATIVRIVAA